MSVGKRIKEARERKNLTQKELAKLLGVSSGAVGNYETSVSNPKTDILYRILEILQIDANYIFQDEMKDNPITKDEILLEKYHTADEGIRKSVNILLKIED